MDFTKSEEFIKRVEDKIKFFNVVPRKPETVNVGDTIHCIDFDGYYYIKIVNQIDENGVNLFQHGYGEEYEAHFYPYVSGYGDELMVIE